MAEMRGFPIATLILVSFLATAVSGQPFFDTFESGGQLNPASRIDELVLAKLELLGIPPARLCSDEVFVRRVYLDVIGTLPTLQEVKEFLADESDEKRRALIDHLLERDEFADYWAMKWGDLLRIKSEFPINLWPNAVQAYHRWIKTCLRDNKPYDQFVREMLTSSGSNFRQPQVNFYRAVQRGEPEAIAQVVALTFMGVRTDNWSEGRLAAMAVFFSRVGYKSTAEWKEEIVFFDAFNTTAPAGRLTFPDGNSIQLSDREDPRAAFASWLTEPGNPWFARNIVNRIWYWLRGRGIIHEPDDIRRDNPARNPELIAWLEQELIDSGYDLKHIYRLILNSATYQFSSVPRSDHPEAMEYFAYYPLRRLDAEVLIDALCQVTGTTEEYISQIPEPFTFIPVNSRAIALGDGSVASSFLEMFGRPPRDTGLESERNNNPTSAQRLHLLNSSHIRNKIERGQQLRFLATSSRRPLEMIRSLYLTVLSRYPTAEELKVVREYSESGVTGRREVAVDLMWALVNSPEFLYRH